ncbi:MAG: hypothetical protein ABW168_11895 [Sedimenticola sp.]
MTSLKFTGNFPPKLMALGTVSESIAHMDVGKKREQGVEALRHKSVVITNNLNAIDSSP